MVMNDATPNGWTSCSLGNLVVTRRGITYSSDELGAANQSLPLYINMKSFRKDGSYNFDGEKYFNASYREIDLLKDDELLIVNTDVTPSGDILGVPLLVPRKYQTSKVLYSHHVTSLKVGDAVSREFLYHLLCHPIIRREIRTHGRGTTVKMLDSKDFLKIDLSIPPIREQNEIVLILSSIEKVILNASLYVEKLEILKTATINQLVNGNPNQKKAWRLTDLSSITKLITKGATPTTYGHEFLKDFDINAPKFYGGTQTSSSGVLILEKFRLISDKAYETLKRSQLVSGDNLLTIVGNSVGDSALVLPEHLPANINQNVALIRANPDLVSGAYLNLLLQSVVKGQIQKEITVQAQPSLSLKQVGDFKIPLPSLDEQNMIIEVISKISESITANKLKLSKFIQLKNGVLDDLITGKVRVTVN